jgi:hypothetical protein
MPLLVALIAALVYLLPVPPKASGSGETRVRELARLTFLAAMIWVLNELATGRPVRLW